MTHLADGNMMMIIILIMIITISPTANRAVNVFAVHGWLWRAQVNKAVAWGSPI
jgi:hypothetical protein